MSRFSTEELVEDQNCENVSDGEIVRQSADFEVEHNEIAACCDEIDSTEQDVEVIQDVQEIVEKAEDGMSPVTAEMTDVVLESLCERLGISKKIIPAMESFGGTMTRKEATNVAMEGIGDTIVRIWTAIKQAFIKLFDRIVAFVSQIFNSNFAVKRKLEATRKLLQETKTDKKEGGENVLDNKHLFSYLNSPETNGVPSIQEALKITDVNKRQLEAYPNTVKAYDAILKNMNEFADNIGKIEDSGDAWNASKRYIESAFNTFDNVNKEVFTTKAKVLGIGSMQTAGCLGFSTAVGVKEFISLSVFNEDISSLHDGSILVAKLQVPKSEKESIEILSKSESTKLFEKTEELFNLLDKRKDSINEIKKYQKDFIKLADRIISDAKSGKSSLNDSSQEDIRRKMKSLSGFFNKNFSKLSYLYTLHARKCVLANVNYIETSLAHYA